jgi:hypothetical protein
MKMYTLENVHWQLFHYSKHAYLFCDNLQIRSANYQQLRSLTNSEITTCYICSMQDKEYNLQTVCVCVCVWERERGGGEGSSTNNHQPHDMVHMLPLLHRKRGKLRKRNPFHGILSKFCTLNTTLHQSHNVSLKANNHNNHRRRAKYVTKCEEINNCTNHKLSDSFCHRCNHFNKNVK